MTKEEDKAGSSKNKGKKFKPPKKITEKYLHNAGLAYLQRFPASTAHFKTVMTRKIDKSCRFHKNQSREDCIALLDPLVSKFQEFGLLDDDAYLKGMITSFRRRGLSSRQIEMKLMQKGLTGNIVKQALQNHDVEEYDTENNGDLHAALIFARRRKLGPYDVTGRYAFERRSR